jgi:hypothetical protein
MRVMVSSARAWNLKQLYPLTSPTKEICMYARNVRVQLRANSAPEFSRLLEQEINPLLRAQKGFQDEISLVAPHRNEAIVISFWDNQGDAERYNHVAYLDVLRLLSKVVDRIPTVETFEVVDFSFDATAR